MTDQQFQTAKHLDYPDDPESGKRHIRVLIGCFLLAVVLVTIVVMTFMDYPGKTVKTHESREIERTDH